MEGMYLVVLINMLPDTSFVKTDEFRGETNVSVFDDKEDVLLGCPVEIVRIPVELPNPIEDICVRVA